MPVVSERQRGFLGADYARAKAGKRTRSGMSEGQLREFLTKKHNTPGDGTGLDADRIPSEQGLDNDYTPHGG